MVIFTKIVLNLIPALIIVYGISNLAVINKPGHILGHKSKVTSKTKEVWEFTNKLSGSIFLVFGLLLLPFTIYTTLYYVDDMRRGAIIGIIGCMLLIVILFVSLVETFARRYSKKIRIKKLAEKLGKDPEEIEDRMR